MAFRVRVSRRPRSLGTGLVTSGVAVLGLAALVGASGAAGAGAARATGPSYRDQLAAAAPLPGQGAQRDVVTKAPIDGTIYAADSAENLLAATEAATKLPLAAGSRAWKERGPFGVDFIPGIANGGEKLASVTGIGTTVAVDPTNPNVAFLGTHGGLYVTRDGGTTVQNLSDGKLPHAPVGAVALDPAHPGDLYVGTGVSLLTISDDQTGVGIYVSHDGGKTFSRPAANIRAYGVNTIAVTGNAVLVGTNAGLYRSTDRGASFHRVVLPTNATHTGPAEDPFGNWIQSIVVRPDDPTEVTIDVGFAEGKYVDSSGTYLGPDNKPIAPGNGLYRSTNRGATFAYFPASGLTTSPEATNDPFGRISLAYGSAPGQGQTLWALVSDAGRATGHSAGELPDLDPFGLGIDPGKASELGGLYRSIDDGHTWSLQATATTLMTALNSTQAGLAALDYAPGVQSSYNNWVATDPVDPNRVYLGLEEAFEGEYGGANPTNVANPLNVELTTKFQVMQRYADLCGFYSSVAYSLGSLVTGSGAQPATGCPNPGPLYGGLSTHPDQHAVAVVKTSGGGVRMYTGNDGGFFVQDAGLEVDSLLGTGNIQGFSNGTWRTVKTGATLLPYHSNFWSNGRLIVGLQDNGAAYVEPNGRGVEICGGDAIEVFPGPTDDSLFCTHGGATTDYVTQNGKKSFDVSPFLAEPFGLTPQAQDPLDHTHMIAAGRDVQELTDLTFQTLDILTNHWSTVFDAGTGPAKAFPGSNCPQELNKGTCDWVGSAASLYGPRSYIGICSACRATLGDSARVNAAVETNVKAGCTPVYGKTTCWHIAKSKGLPKRRIGGIAFDPTDPKTVYVGLQDLTLIGYDPAKNGMQRVMVSHDGGDTFTDVSGNLPLTSVWGMVIRDHKPIIATDVGVFTAAANSSTWSRLGTGLPAVRAQDVRLDPTGRYVVASMYGRSAWTYDFGTRASSGSNVVPPARTPRSLASTGSAPTLGAVGLLLMLAGLALRRLRRA